jgi:hypothetical protein
MKCHGLHCDGCRHGGGGAAAVIALLAFIALALRKDWPQIVSALEIAAWTVAAVTGAAIAVTVTVLTVRAVRRHRARLAMRQATIYRPGLIIPPAQSGGRPVPSAQRPAIGRPRRHHARTWPLPDGRKAILPLPGRDDDSDRRAG